MLTADYLVGVFHGIVAALAIRAIRRSVFRSLWLRRLRSWRRHDAEVAARMERDRQFARRYGQPEPFHRAGEREANLLDARAAQDAESVDPLRACDGTCADTDDDERKAA